MRAPVVAGLFPCSARFLSMVITVRTILVEMERNPGSCKQNDKNKALTKSKVHIDSRV